MPTCPYPADEADRQATLARYRVVGSAPDARFDRLVEMAAQYFNVPISLVSLVDGSRQWFKAARGVDLTETTRDDAFCAHAILAPGEVLVVEDAAADPRFCANPLVTHHPKVRFYAGAPIAGDDGQPLGTLCILDHKPRTLDAAGREFLRSLAGSAAAMFELHRSNLLLSEAALRDPLTGLANRRALDAALADAMQGAFEGRPFGLLCLDLDRFKAINDLHGHERGDALLRLVGERLSAGVRANDIPARIGGDEFAVLVSGPVDAALVGRLARRIMTELMMPAGTVREGFSVRESLGVRVSIGGALAPLHGTNDRELLRAADAGLYAAKRAGGNRFVMAQDADERDFFAGTEGGPAELAAAALPAALRTAIETNALTLNWQPYFSAETRRMVGLEALVRWTTADAKPIPPSIFIPVAENSGLIGALDRWVLRKACRDAREMPAGLRVAVNISAYWLSRGQLEELVRTTLAEMELAPERLVLEVTERMVVDQPSVARGSMEALRKLGVSFALDDFGVGYSSLGALRELPFDILKLDRSFLAGVDSDPRSHAVVDAIVDLGHALGMKVCGEGVEDAAQLDVLRRAGCDFIQGYFLARPQDGPGVGVRIGAIAL